MIFRYRGFCIDFSSGCVFVGGPRHISGEHALGFQLLSTTRLDFVFLLLKFFLGWGLEYIMIYPLTPGNENVDGLFF